MEASRAISPDDDDGPYGDLNGDGSGVHADNEEVSAHESDTGMPKQAQDAPATGHFDGGSVPSGSDTGTSNTLLNGKSSSMVSSSQRSFQSLRLQEVSHSHSINVSRSSNGVYHGNWRRCQRRCRLAWRCRSACAVRWRRHGESQRLIHALPMHAIARRPEVQYIPKKRGALPPVGSHSPGHTVDDSIFSTSDTVDVEPRKLAVLSRALRHAGFLLDTLLTSRSRVARVHADLAAEIRVYNCLHTAVEHLMSRNACIPWKAHRLGD